MNGDVNTGHLPPPRRGVNYFAQAISGKLRPMRQVVQARLT
jgi:hypothetical protein